MVDCSMASGVRWVALGVEWPFIRECNGNTQCLRAVECVCLWLRRSWQTLKIEGETDTAVHEAVVTFLFEPTIHNIEYRSRSADPIY